MKKIDIGKIKLPQDGETIKETLSNVARYNLEVEEALKKKKKTSLKD